MSISNFLDKKYKGELILNNENQNKDNNLTINEVLTLLSTYELSNGNFDVQVDIDRVKGKHKEYLDKLKNGYEITELIDSVKRKVRPLN